MLTEISVVSTPYQQNYSLQQMKFSITDNLKIKMQKCRVSPKTILETKAQGLGGEIVRTRESRSLQLFTWKFWIY